MQRLRQRILDELSWDARFENADIGVEEADGQIHLFGKVHSLAQFEDAQLAVWRVSGVNAVKNDLVIAVAPSDDQLLWEALKQALKSESEIDHSTIEYRVEDGVVELRGIVGSVWQKQRVAELASSIGDVVVVENRLQVVPGYRAGDREIARQIEMVLEMSAEMDEKALTVEVNDAVVVLKGLVPHLNAYLAAQYAAAHVRGVKEVKNQLLIN